MENPGRQDDCPRYAGHGDASLSWRFKRGPGDPPDGADGLRTLWRTRKEEEANGIVLNGSGPPQPFPKTLEFARFSRKEIAMDNTTIIQMIAGVLAVLVLGFLIQRRRTRAK